MSTQCHTPFDNCPTLISTGWSCNETNHSYPDGLAGGHYSQYLDDESYYDRWDKIIEEEVREMKEVEDFEAHVVDKKELHTPDPNIPRLGEFGPAKKILRAIKVEKRRKASYKKKQTKSILKVDEKAGDDWLLKYMEEFEYWEYNHTEVETIV